MQTKRNILGTAAVAAMAGAGAVSLTVLESWVGDVGALLWVCACFFFPFIFGIAWGPGAQGRRGVAVGAVAGGALALLPGVGYVALANPDVAGVALTLLWAGFTPLGMAQGAIAMPVGGTARKRKVAPQE